MNCFTWKIKGFNYRENRPQYPIRAVQEINCFTQKVKGFTMQMGQKSQSCLNVCHQII